MFRIIVAEDELANIHVLKLHFNAIGLLEKCCFCLDGESTINSVKQIVI